MNASTIVLLATISASLGVGAPPRNATPTRVPLQKIAANDNRRAAGTVKDGKLELKLDIVNARWFPESDSGPSVVMQAFAEVGRQPEVPGPVIHVRQGIEIH